MMQGTIVLGEDLQKHEDPVFEDKLEIVREFLIVELSHINHTIRDTIRWGEIKKEDDYYIFEIQFTHYARRKPILFKIKENSRELLIHSMNAYRRVSHLTDDVRNFWITIFCNYK